MRTDPLRNHLHQEIKNLCLEKGVSYREALNILKRKVLEQELAERFPLDPKREKAHQKILKLSLENKISYLEALNLLRKKPHLF